MAEDEGTCEMSVPLTAERLRELLLFDPASGGKLLPPLNDGRGA
jgi:hypothetical protein